MGNRFEIELPERQNSFFNAMTEQLPPQLFNISRSYMVVQEGPVTLRGCVPPTATVSIFVNGVDQFPTTTIEGDANGDFTVQLNLVPGENQILVQFFPPEIQEILDQSSSGGFNEELELQHPTLFSTFTLDPDSTVQAIAMQNDFVYIGGVPTAGGDSTIARIDLTTAVTIHLSQTDSPAGPAKPTVITSDATYVYTNTDLVSGNKINRYPLDLSALVQYTPAGKGEALYADGTDLFLLSLPAAGSDTLELTKIDPTTFLATDGPDIMDAGILSDARTFHHSFADDGTELVFQLSDFLFSHAFGIDDIEQGTPPMGESLFQRQVYYKRALKSDLSSQGNVLIINEYVLSSGETFMNSLIASGGFFYTVVEDNQGKILKLQENSGDWDIIEVIPLPFDTSVSGPLDVVDTPRMTLGGDGKIYVAGNGSIARFTPGSTTLEVIGAGKRTIVATSTNMAVVDDLDTTRAKLAPLTIFTDRSTSVPVPAPAVPTNVRCHYSITNNDIGLAWDSTEGNGYIIELDTDGGGFSEAGRQYIGKAHVIATPPTFAAGTVFTVRVKAINATGTSVASATATVTIPSANPPIQSQTGLVSTGVTGSSVDLQWTDNEIDPGGPITGSSNRAHTGHIYRADATTPAAVTFTDVGDLVNFNAHPFSDNDSIEFDSIVTTTGISLLTSYFVVNSNVNDFQVSLTKGGAAIALTTDGSGTIVGPFVDVGFIDIIFPSSEPDKIIDFTDNNAVSGLTEYHYFIRATSTIYFPSLDSNILSVTTVESVPATPVNVTSESAWEGIKISWDDGVGGGDVDDYFIERSLTGTGGWTPLITIAAPTTVHFDDTGTRIQQYFYRVRAENTGGASANSSSTSPGVKWFPRINVLDTFPGNLITQDATHVYLTNGNPNSSPQTQIGVVKVDKTDSSNRTDTRDTGVALTTGTTINPQASYASGGFLYIAVHEHPSVNGRLVKINTSTLAIAGTLNLGFSIGFNNAQIVETGGKFFLLAPDDSANVIRAIEFNPTTMAQIASTTYASTVGADNIPGATVFGGSIYFASRVTAPASIRINKMNPTTRTITAFYTIPTHTTILGLTDDGSNVYAHVATAGFQSRIHKVTSALAFVLESGDLGNDFGTRGGITYHSGSSGIYIVGSVSNSDVNKINPTLLTVISGKVNQSLVSSDMISDASYIYISDSNGGIYTRETGADF